MPDNTPATYPLAWPPGWPRTPPSQRQAGAFKTSTDVAMAEGGFKKMERPITVAAAIDRLHRQVGLLGGEYAVVSTNMELRRDGRPYSDGRMFNPDPGAALYFRLKGRATAMPCDRYLRLADNIAAIAAHIDAVRRIERYGVGTAEQMFTGFQALRGPGPKPWRETFGFKPEEKVTIDIVRQRHRERARQIHPDVAGAAIHGADAAMAELNAARDAALEDLANAQ